MGRFERDHGATAEPAQAGGGGQGVDADVGADVDHDVAAPQFVVQEPH